MPEPKPGVFQASLGPVWRWVLPSEWELGAPAFMGLGEGAPPLCREGFPLLGGMEVPYMCWVGSPL